MNYFEFNEMKTQRSTAHDLIEFPDVYVTESVLNDDEQNELRREISRLAIRAMRAEESV